AIYLHRNSWPKTIPED
ncbi:hypothetical protein D046_0848B, partial [Vibrio parahaemolyticus V-223/04]